MCKKEKSQGRLPLSAYGERFTDGVWGLTKQSKLKHRIHVGITKHMDQFFGFEI